MGLLANDAACNVLSASGTACNALRPNGRCMPNEHFSPYYISI